MLNSEIVIKIFIISFKGLFEISKPSKFLKKMLLPLAEKRMIKPIK